MSLWERRNPPSEEDPEGFTERYVIKEIVYFLKDEVDEVRTLQQKQRFFESWILANSREKTATLKDEALIRVKGAFTQNVFDPRLGFETGIVDAYVLEYVPDSQDLLEFNKNPNMDFAVRLDLAIQFLWALDRLHSQKRIHRDLKPENILIYREFDRYKVKIIDPGFQTTYKMIEHFSDHQLGTPLFRSPETYKSYYTTIPTDVFAAGAVLYEMFTQGSMALNVEDAYEITYAISKKATEQIDFRKIEDKEVRAILKKMLTADPKKRTSIGKALQQLIRIQDKLRNKT